MVHSKPSVINTRRGKRPLKWVTVSVKYIDGGKEEVAKFRSCHPGDTHLYIQQLSKPGTTVEEIILS